MLCRWIVKSDCKHSGAQHQESLLSRSPRARSFRARSFRARGFATVYAACCASLGPSFVHCHKPPQQVRNPLQAFQNRYRLAAFCNSSTTCYLYVSFRGMPSIESKQPIQVAIVGSGMAGLLTAFLLSRDPYTKYSVKIFESVRIYDMESNFSRLTHCRGSLCHSIPLLSRFPMHLRCPPIALIYPCEHLPEDTIRT